MSNTITPTVFYRTLKVEEFGVRALTIDSLRFRKLTCVDYKLRPPFRLSSSEKMKMPRDEARVRRCSKKASPKPSTIKCVRHPGRRRRVTNQSHNSRLNRRFRPTP